MPIEGNTHGLLLAGAGATTATETNLGTISLPAGGPWLIHDVFALVANATATAAELTGGYFRFDAASGDLTPQPAPSRFPVRGATSTLGATIDRSTCKLNLFPVAWEAPGKANIDIIVANNTTNTVAANVAEEMQDIVSKALLRAWHLGQTYLSQADSDSFIQNKKSDETQAKFNTLVDETRAALASSPASNAETQNCV